eukprot:GFUD01003875.1.p1 GENE.GFUD01003875.1~~GFUD01003875.1.p1  ORF type:complete len:443 (+),score=136.99 GFUD01003875.1:43-1371(+)
MSSTGVHDIGGLEEEFGPIDLREHGYQLWEMQVHATLVLLAQQGLLTTDELRRSVEALPGHTSMSYYHRWAAGMTAICIERGTVSAADLNMAHGEPELSVGQQSLVTGQVVRVRREDARVRWRKPHLRTPGYLFGAVGVVERFLGCFPNPEEKAFSSNQEAGLQPLYLVAFKNKDLWKGMDVHGHDGITAEIYQPWLEIIDGKMETNQDPKDNVVRDIKVSSSKVDHGDHVHDTRHETEAEALRRETVHEDPIGEKTGQVLLKLLLEKKVFEINEVRKVVEKMDNTGKMLLGQQLVVKAWTDPEFKQRLLADGNAAADELGMVASNANAPTKFIVVENTSSTHHLIVCTLCSCYPSSIMGMAPPWYKSRSYRARAVREPRKVLLEFGLRLAAEMCLVVHDSTADCRYMVLPRRPEGTDGWGEKELIGIVTRDCLLGVAVPRE